MAGYAGAVFTHDLAFARMIGGRLIVLRDDAAVETCALGQVFAKPGADCTRLLIGVDPARRWRRRRGAKT